jgi:hypothetical protein
LSYTTRVILDGARQGGPEAATDGKVTARLTGFATVDVAKGKLTALMLVSDEGNYTWHWQGKPQSKAMSVAIELGP